MRAPRWLQILLGLVWVALGLSAVVVWWFSELSVFEVPEHLSRWLDDFGVAPAVLLVLALYTVRPLTVGCLVDIVAPTRRVSEGFCRRPR